MTALELVRLIKRQRDPWWLMPAAEEHLILDAKLFGNSILKLRITGPRDDEPQRDLLMHVVLVDKIDDGVIAVWVVERGRDPRPFAIVRDDRVLSVPPALQRLALSA